MKYVEKDVSFFIKIYWEEYGVDISREQAIYLIERLIEFYNQIYRLEVIKY